MYVRSVLAMCWQWATHVTQVAVTIGSKHVFVARFSAPRKRSWRFRRRCALQRLQLGCSWVAANFAGRRPLL